MALSGYSPDELLGKLVREENFRGFTFSPAEEATSDENRNSLEDANSNADSRRSSSDQRRPRFQTRLDPEKLEKRLTKVFREQRTLEEEQGISTLYLAIGFLKWFESDQAEEASFAPLILVPVTIVRTSGGDGYLLRGRDDEIGDNTSLREKLRTNFGVQLPPIPDGERWKPSIYFDEIENEIRRLPRWEVDRTAIGLGFFSFSKFMMWRDLDNSTWPDDALLDHPLINILLGNGSNFETLPALVSDDEPIDKHIDLSKCVHVINADSSQAIVIEEARIGRNLVVQGPPGTGKSQTITNLIAAAVHAGKKVLFVAEKTAALEVVYDRLRRAGLGPLCLEVHSRKASKSEVLKSLEQSFRLGTVPKFDETVPFKLAACRDQLNQWSRAMHEPIGDSGRTPFEVIGRQVKLRADATRLLDVRLHEAATWTAAKIATVEEVTTRAANILSQLQLIPQNHPWFGTNIDAQSPFDLDRLNPKLNATIAMVTRLAEDIRRVFALLTERREPSLANASAAISAFRHLASAPVKTRTILSNSVWTTKLDAVEHSIDDAENLASSIAAADALFVPEARATDAAALMRVLRADGPSFFRRFNNRYRTAVADLRANCRDKLPRSLEGRLALLEKLLKGQEARRKFDLHSALLSQALGSLWANDKTSWAEARMLATWARQAVSELGSNNLFTLAAKTTDLHVFSKFADALEDAISKTLSLLQEIQQAIRPDPRVLFSTSDLNSATLPQIAARLALWRENLARINEWVTARNILQNLRDEGLDGIAQGLISGTINPQEIRPAVDLLVAEALWKRAAHENPELLTLEGDVRRDRVEQFRKLDEKKIRLSSNEVLERFLEQRPSILTGEVGIIKTEIEKKRGHRPIRKLMKEAGSAVQRLKPIFLMSPLSVAQFLPPGHLRFDLVVIDEASQIAPEDALGALARAKQIVVVGDDKQLPPTNFFKIVNAGDDDESDEAEEAIRANKPSDFESILSLSRAKGMSERMLAWHYRSKHPSLIAFSNHECYSNRLLLPPSPFYQTSDFGMSFVKTPRGHYDRGGTSRDLVQAGDVAKAVAEHIKNRPSKSLGVACLSVQQRDAVDDMIDKLGIRSEVEDFSPKGERLFVKNLEAVQGDERDVIFISVGYGVAPEQSRPFLNFGPVSRDGGERRLNVLASRARERCVVFSSITAADIPADTEVRGTRMLRTLLGFAETGSLPGIMSGGGFDSPFEEAVARVITESGFVAHSQVGVRGFRIDLGIIDPARPGEYILGVECDGAAYHSARSARDRDRLRQEVLESMGWRLHRIWSTDWFRNPMRETDRLLAAIASAKEQIVPRKTDPPAEEELSGTQDTDSAEPIESDENMWASRAVDYEECVLAVPFRRNLLDLPLSDVARLALSVVETEGPIHSEEVARRIRESFDLQKTGKRILERVVAGLKQLSRDGSVIQQGEFWSATGRSLSLVRRRRNVALSLRRASMIAPAEYQLAISTVITEAISITRNDLLTETARLFGFDRTGPDIKEAIGNETDSMIREGRLRLDGNVLRLQ
jgi:very-short-patch-repair endonuclease